MLTCPTNDDFLPEACSQIGVYRLLTVSGIVLVLLFSIVYDSEAVGPVDPTWVWVGLAGLYANLLAASYLLKPVRETYGVWLRSGLYLLMGWFVVVTTLNQFAPNYAVGLLFTYAILTAVLGMGASSLYSMLSFAVSGVLLTAVGTIMGPGSPETNPGILLGCMGVLAAVECLTLRERVSTRQMLSEREARLQGLADSISGVVFQFYALPDGTYGNSFVSDQAENLLGISADTSNFFDRFLERIPTSHRQDVIAAIDKVVEERESWQFEMPFEKPSGETIWLLGTSTPTSREDRLVFNGLLLDITERKEQERQLRQAKQEAEEAYRLKSTFLANISHEIRTPLTSIIGFAEAIGEEAEELEERLQDTEFDHFYQFSDTIAENGHRLLETLNDVLNLSKLEAGEMKYTPRQVNLVEEIEKITTLLEPRADEARITLNTAAESDPIWTQVDPGALRIVLRNLISNAIKYTEAGGDVSIRAETNGCPILEVEDNGIGMDPEDVPRLFRAFRQGSEGVDREFEGSGLGLAVTQKILTRMDASIDVETEKGVGTRFTVELPPAQRSDSSAVTSRSSRCPAVLKSS